MSRSEPPTEEPAVTIATLLRDSGERFQTLRRELGVHAFGLNMIVLRPGERGRIHTHEQQEEVFVVIEGELTLIVEGAEHRLAADQLARVPPARKRQLVNRAATRLVLLAIGGAGEHVGRDGRAWSPGRSRGRAARRRRCRCRPTSPPAPDLRLPPDLPQA